MRNYIFQLPVLVTPFVCVAQVPVSKEPMHHNVFENSYVRILDVQLAPGDTTQFHKHETPSVFIVLQPVKTGSEVIIEESQATALSGDPSISFEGFYKTPRIHRVWNEDTILFHVMDIEILSKHVSQPPPLHQKELSPVLEDKPVRVYRLKLDQETDFVINNERPFLVVGLDDTSQEVIVNKKATNKKGDYLFIPSGEGIVFRKRGQQPYSFAEFK